jgi:hypothetical protein
MDGPGQNVPDYLQAASSITADGYICEVSIEYGQMLSLDFSAGNTIGLHPCIDDTDIDDGDTEYQMSWTGLGAHDQSMGFGHMLLSADPADAPEPVVPFSLGAVEDIELGNDPQTGPDSNANGSGLGARDIPDRRRVILISYDISALKERGPVSDVSFNHFSHDQHGEVNVYGVIEDLDLLEVESLTWNTAPGVQNDPTPELNSPVALDMNDITDVLLTFAGPGEMGIRFSTDTSQALADFINSDTDGILTFLIAPAAEGNQLIVRARTHSAGGTLLEGDTPPLANIIWVSDNLKYDFNAGVPSDQGFIDLLTAEGYLVDYKGQYDPHEPGNDEVPVNPDWLYWRELNDDKIAELEAADLIIIARDCASSKYDDTNEADMWNAISTPIISQNAHISRQLSKWGWFATGSTTNKTPRLMQVVAPDHPIFDGVAIDPNGNVDMVVQDAQVTLVKLNEGVVEGNGTLLGVHDEGYPWIVEWAADVEYYEGSGQIAGGPRMFLGSAVGATNEAAGLIEGGYNLTADGETVFLNAVKYMLPTKPVDPGTDSLMAYWPLNEGAGDTTADIVGGHDGTLKGGVAWAGEGSPANGDALSFDGYSDGVHHATDPGTINWVSVDPFDVVGPGITLAAWIRPDGFDIGDARIITKQKTWSSSDIWWMLSTYTDGTALRMRLKTDDGGADGGTTTMFSDTGYLEVGVWSHVAATYDGSKMRLYHNGVEIMSTDKTGTIQTDPTAAVAIGNSPLGDPGGLRATFHGLIDDTRIYDRALSEPEILFLAGGL